MKRFTAAILIFSFVLILCGCSSQRNVTEPVSFYYCTSPVDYNSPEGVISAEVRDKCDCGDDLLTLLNSYILGPETDDFSSPFPAGTRVLSVTVNDSTAEICLNDVFTALSGHTLTVASICICKTVMDVTGCNTFHIQTQTQDLDIEMSGEDFIFLDDYTLQIQQ